MQKGMIKMFDSVKGFGFILTEDDDDVFFSIQDVHPKFKNVRIREEMEVAFDLKREMKGDRAVNVRILG